MSYTPPYITAKSLKEALNALPVETLPREAQIDLKNFSAEAAHDARRCGVTQAEALMYGAVVVLLDDEGIIDGDLCVSKDLYEFLDALVESTPADQFESAYSTIDKAYWGKEPWEK